MLPGKTIWNTASVYKETSETITIVFDTNGRHFDYKAGQFITVSLVIDGEAVSRSYSLSSCPGNEEKPSITVKKINHGIVSNYLFHHSDEIDSWLIEGPFGEFHPTSDVTRSNEVILCAAGSGITPVFSILKYLLTNTDAAVTLLYSSKTWSNTIFQPVLSWLEKTYSTRLTIQYFLTEEKENAGKGSNYFHGRISKLLLKKFLKKKIVNEQSPPVFVCGPYSYIELVTGCLKEIGLDEKFIHKEFFAIPVTADQGCDMPEQTLEVLLHFNEQSNLLAIEPRQTILDAALADKIALPYSCKQGSCGICISRLTSGNVQMKNNFSLDKDQLAAGAVLLCQSYPLDNEVTVEVNTL